ncbi:zf-CCHC domain-containing protein [Tanacetum coccineum]
MTNVVPAPPTDPPKSKDGSSKWWIRGSSRPAVHEVVMEKDFEIYRGKKERVKSIALKAKKYSSDDETLTSESDDEEYDMVKGKSDRKCFRCGDPNHLIGDCPKPPCKKDQKTFIGGSWSDSKNDDEDKTNDELVSWLNHQISSKASTNGTKPLNFVGLSVESTTARSTIKVHRSTIPGSVNSSSAEKVTEHDFSLPMSSSSDFVIIKKKLIHNRIEDSKKLSLKPSLKSSLGYVKTESRSKIPPPKRNVSSQPRHNTPQPRRNSREPIHQNFPPLTKLSPLIDDDVGEEEAIKNYTKVVNNNNEEDESIKVDEVVNIKESKNHPLEQVIGNLNLRTLRSQAQNHSNFFCFISTIEPKDVNEALKDES